MPDIKDLENIPVEDPQDSQEDDSTEYFEEMRFAVDIPNPNDERGSWITLEYFTTRDEAIKWAKDNLGADDEGMICVISQF